MFPIVVPLGAGFLGLGLVAAALALAYPVLWVWMVIDGVVRSDADYPGTGANRKVLWVLAMVLVHPVVIAYLFAVYLKARNSHQGATAPHAATAPAPPIPHASTSA
jgi:hypothetical protein